MAKLSVCIEMFWRDSPYGARIAKAAALGFSAVEFWGWSNKDLDEIAAALDDTGLTLAACCMESARPLVDPNAGDALEDGLKRSADVAARLGVERLILTTGNVRAKESFHVTRNTVVRHLRRLAPLLAERDLSLVLEPLNPVVNHLGYWLTTMPDAADICYDVDSPFVKILMDVYHQQITEGNIIDTARCYARLIGHVHTAGVPGRHELVGGELDYRAVFKALDELGYDGYCGLEFSPVGSPEAALQEALALVH